MLFFNILRTKKHILTLNNLSEIGFATAFDQSTFAA
jgi:hypothetical protein